MSNDLISRKALLTELSKWDISKMYFPDAFKELVKEQPTAYDIDDIVEQLEEKAEPTYLDRMEERVGKKQTTGFALGIREAIEIVKGGGNE
jgi:hypothetical protein